jgi:predicted GNAT family acetyltransferase
MNQTHVGTELEVRHGEGCFYVERGGRTLAELTYAMDDEGRAVLEHTRVDDELRGEGVARRLVDAAVAWARATGTRLVPVCSYARAIFHRDRSLSDVLA